MTAEDRVRAAARALRADLGLSQQQVADRMTSAGARMYRSSLAQIEAGNRGISVNELGALADALGVTAPQLLDGSAVGEAKRRRAVALRAEADRLEREAERLSGSAPGSAAAPLPTAPATAAHSAGTPHTPPPHPAQAHPTHE